MPGMDRAATTIRFEATPAKEFVLYSWTLRARHSGALDSSGEDSAAAPAGDLSIAVTLFTLPSYRGLFGFARRLSANTIALWETVGGPPWPYLQVCCLRATCYSTEPLIPHVS